MRRETRRKETVRHADTHCTAVETTPQVNIECIYGVVSHHVALSRGLLTKSYISLLYFSKFLSLTHCYSSLLFSYRRDDAFTYTQAERHIRTHF